MHASGTVERLRGARRISPRVRRNIPDPANGIAFTPMRRYSPTMNSIRPLLAALFLIATLVAAPDADAQPMRPIEKREFDYGTGNPDFETIIHVLLGGAKKVLEEEGEFYPSALALDTNGTLNAIFPYEEGMTVEALIEKSLAILSGGARSGAFAVTGLLYDVYAIPPGETIKVDAMMVQLENRDGAVLFYLPYRKEGGTVSYGRSWLGLAKPVVFSP
jgi:hypothetical protein